MSLDTFYSEIRRFLESPDPEVLIISGKWGVGKTFAWNTLLEEARRAGRIKLERYAYVSLFGLGSLEDVKGAVFQNTVGREQAGVAADISTLDSALKSATSGWRQGLSLVRSAVTDYAAITGEAARIGYTGGPGLDWPRAYLSAKPQLEKEFERQRAQASASAGLSAQEQANKALGV